MSMTPAANPIAVVIDHKLTRAVAKWAYQSDDRPHITPVMFGNAEMVAVDGHRLVRVPLDYTGPRFGIDARDLSAAIGALVAMQRPGRQSDQVVIGDRGSDGMTSICLGVGLAWAHEPSVRLRYTDGRDFPPVDGVMPSERPDKGPDGYGFNPRYLAAIDEVERAAGAHDGMNIVRCTGWAADGLGGMLFQGYRGIRYVIMPGRL